MEGVTVTCTDRVAVPPDLPVTLDPEARPGSGGYGTLYPGTHSSGARVAVKIQRAGATGENEARILQHLRDAALPHAPPFVVDFYASARWIFTATRAATTHPIATA